MEVQCQCPPHAIMGAAGQKSVLRHKKKWRLPRGNKTRIGTAGVAAPATSGRGITGSGTTPSIATSNTRLASSSTAPGTTRRSITRGSSPGATTSITAHIEVVAKVALGLPLVAIGTLRHILREELGDDLISLEKGTNQDRANGIITLGEERGGETAVTDATSTT